MEQIQEKITRASRLRDVMPEEALNLIGIVRVRLQDAPSPGPVESIARWQAECSLNAAWANVRLGRFVAAYPEAEEGLRLFQQQGQLQGAAGCLLVKGIALGEDGNSDESVKLCREAEALFLKAGDKFGVARAINAQGTAYRRIGDSAGAIEAYGHSMAVAQDNGDSEGVSRATANIGYVYLCEKKFETAIEFAKRALIMARAQGNLANELTNCCNLVQALVGAERPQEAVDLMKDYDFEKLSQSGLFSFLELSEGLSLAFIKVGRYADAEALLKMGIKRARRDGNLRQLGSLLCTLARLHRAAPVGTGGTRSQGLMAARAALEEALNHGRSRDWDIVQGIHEEFCDLCREEQCWDEAFDHMKEAHRIALKLSAASADERLARQRSEQEAANLRARAAAEARQNENERKLLRLQKAESLAVLSGGIAHNFNNLLAAILSNAELAEMYPTLAKDAFAEVRASGRRAADLCQQMLIYTGQTHHHMAIADLSAIIEAAVQPLHRTLLSGCEVALDFPPESLAVWGDRTELQQIMMVLLTNSAEAGATTIRFKAVVVHPDEPCGESGALLDSGAYIELTVTDNGKGMTTAVLARVFEPFFSTKFDGRGLGLPAAMGLVHAHKGTMAVESTPGSGTTVRIQLPVAPDSVPLGP